MAYSTTTERAAASEQLIINAILPGLRGVKPNRIKGGWNFFCPLEHRKKTAPAAIWVNDEGWISVHCFDCRRRRRATPSPGGPAPSRPTSAAADTAPTCARATSGNTERLAGQDLGGD